MFKLAICSPLAKRINFISKREISFVQQSNPPLHRGRADSEIRRNVNGAAVEPFEQSGQDSRRPLGLEDHLTTLLR
jgi:hypothetical protein